MGVPSYFRWLSGKFPKIIQDVREDSVPMDETGKAMGRVDISAPNPNGLEFDTLYLDMNGIIHPCSHPENAAQPANDGEIMENIFRYIDRLVQIVRPRRLLYMAIDGVAPRAKMNQQRSRRFRAARESRQKAAAEASVQEDLLSLGRLTPDDIAKKKKEDAEKRKFDSNCITPGTPFMDLVAKSLQYYITDRLNSDPGWRHLQVILSDASVPGEGEHKIMEFIRTQRAAPDYEPNTRHCMYGLDADLIMLGLATHEPHFTILREVVTFKGPGRAAPAAVPTDREAESAKQVPYQFLHLNVLREYLAADLFVEGLPFAWEAERAYDDYVCMCFLVGNDFLPHHPALEIREGAIDLLCELWKRSLPAMGGYLTQDGEVDLGRLEMLLQELGQLETEILLRRRQREKFHRQRRIEEEAKRRRQESEALLIRDEQNKRDGVAPSVPAPLFSLPPQFQLTPQLPVGGGANLAVPIMTSSSADNKSAAAKMRAELLGLTPPSAPAAAEATPALAAPPPAPPDGDLEDSGPRHKRSASEVTPPEPSAEDSDAQPPPAKRTKLADPTTDPANPLAASASTERDVRFSASAGSEGVEGEEDPLQLGTDGWRERYYKAKFGIDLNDPEDKPFLGRLAKSYLEGIQWVLRYYYQGCCSWTWYFPFHYAPFAFELKEIGSLKLEFSKGQPFSPYEQLMGVLPADSGKSCLPAALHALMVDTESPILDFYPENFEIDMNGKKFEWQGVALLPFIDEQRLLQAVRPVEASLAPALRRRNAFGHDTFLLHNSHPASSLVQSMLAFSQDILSALTDASDEEKSQELAKTRVQLDPGLTKSITGAVGPFLRGLVEMPFNGPVQPPRIYDDEEGDHPPEPVAHFPVVEANQVLAVLFFLLQLPDSHRFKAALHSKVTMPQPVLTSWDLAKRRSFKHFGPDTPASRILDFTMRSGPPRDGSAGGPMRDARDRDRKPGGPYLSEPYDSHHRGGPYRGRGGGPGQYSRDYPSGGGNYGNYGSNNYQGGGGGYYDEYASRGRGGYRGGGGEHSNFGGGGRANGYQGGGGGGHRHLDDYDQRGSYDSRGSYDQGYSAQSDSRGGYMSAQSPPTYSSRGGRGGGGGGNYYSSGGRGGQWNDGGSYDQRGSYEQRPQQNFYGGNRGGGGGGGRYFDYGQRQEFNGTRGGRGGGGGGNYYSGGGGNYYSGGGRGGGGGGNYYNPPAAAPPPVGAQLPPALALLAGFLPQAQPPAQPEMPRDPRDPRHR